MHSGHNAPFVFSAGHNTFLPPGLSLDADGVLKGDDPARLSKLTLPLCVRQIDVERCKDIKIGEKTETPPDNIAKPLDNGSGPPKKGSGAGRAIAVVGGLALAAGGIAMAAGAAQMADEGSAGGSGGMTYFGTSGLSCFYNAGGVVSRCSGTIIVDITQKISAGSRLKLLTSGAIQSDIVVSTTSPPGRVIFPISAGTGGCPPPVSYLSLFNTSVSTSTEVASVGGISIPVTCR